MPIEFYHHPLSQPSRAVAITAQLLKVPLKEHVIDLFKGENRTPEYMKMNPTHAVPTLVDNGFVLYESRAILAYLVNNFGYNSPLYPNDPKKRAKVDMFLYYDGSSISVSVITIRSNLFLKGAKPEQQVYDVFKDKLEIFAVMIGDNKFVTGDQITIADISIACNIGFFINESFVPKVVKEWYERVMSEIPALQEANKAEATALQQFLKAQKPDN